MTNVNITNATTLSIIATLRVAAIDADRGVYGARRDYAAGLSDISTVAWYEIEANGGKLPEAIEGEKNAYYAGLKAIGYSNPSNAWKMIKQYAKQDAIKRALFGEVADIQEGTAESEGAGSKARPLDLRLIEELTALYKACTKVDSLSKKQEGAFKGIKEALKAMGVDTALINEGK
jgi:hypothetical protein